MRGYDPADISVRVEANRKLTVSARHVESGDDTGSRGDAVTRQMSKTVDVPRGVLPHCITSYLAGDGYLTVIAQVSDGYDVTSGDDGISASSSGQLHPRDCEFRPIQRKSNSTVLSPLMAIGSTAAEHDDVSLAGRNVVRTGTCIFFFWTTFLTTSIEIEFAVDILDETYETL